jgi:hypothetical protein
MEKSSRENFRMYKSGELELVNTRLKDPEATEPAKKLRSVELYNNRPAKKLRLSKNAHITFLKVRSDRRKTAHQKIQGARFAICPETFLISNHRQKHTSQAACIK